jgi:hypothetical protein
MAKKIVCDICNKECDRSGFYKLYYSCLLCDFKKQDICYECISRIRQDIKIARLNENE